MATTPSKHRFMVQSVSHAGAEGRVSVSLTEIPEGYDPAAATVPGAPTPGMPYGNGLTLNLAQADAKAFFPPAVFTMTLTPETSTS